MTGKEIVHAWREAEYAGFKGDALLIDAIDTALAAELEACAKVAENKRIAMDGWRNAVCLEIADAIRARRTP